MEDIKKLGYDTENLTGLLRFELALKRKFMKSQGFIREEFMTTDSLADTLVSIINQAPELLQKLLYHHYGMVRCCQRICRRNTSEENAEPKRRNIKNDCISKEMQS